jgi:hypothetical protein
MKPTLTLLALAFISSGCTSSRSFELQTSRHLLHETVNDAGEEVAYTLVTGSDGVPSITRKQERKYEVAQLGVRTRSINRETGEASALVPWRGLLVDRVESASPAARAGIVRGDVLLNVDGYAVSTSEQLKEHLEANVQPGAEVSVSLLEVGSDGKYPAEPTYVSVTLGSKQVGVTKSDTVQLDADVGVFWLTGLQAGSLSPELASEVYDSSEPVTLVAGTLVGSPAYLAGLRSGDRILSCDGRAVTSNLDISRAVLARAQDLELPANWFDASTRRDLPRAEGDIVLEVDGPLGPHRAALAVVDDLKDSFHLHIPILYSHNSDVDSTSWSFLDFIFQFGASYRTRYRLSATRATSSDSILSFFPFGMFEFERKHDYDLNRFFWFIKFKSDH